MNSIKDIWDTILKTLRKDLSEVTLSAWFDEVVAVDLKDSVLLLYCPNEFKKGYIESLFLKNIRAALKELFSYDMGVRLLTDEEFQNYGKVQEKKPASLLESGEFTFDTFIVGGSNKLAHAAARAVAEAPAERYNPLLIYGDSGLGKTHLIYAIAHEIRRRDPNSRIVYIKGDDFTNELVQAIQSGTTAAFKEKYRKADLLLMDDVQFIAGKQQTEEEFFHTFNTLYESKRQIVLTSDRPPAEMTKLSNRLQTRFEWGMLADVQPPDFETRLAIVKSKAAQRGTVLDEKLAVYIAENVTANVRQLEGSINKILAYRDLEGRDLDENTVNRAFQDILKRSNEFIPTADSIISECCRYFNLEESVIRGKQQSANVVKARQVAMYLINHMTNLSLTDIGTEFGRDHTTVMHSRDKVAALIKKDPAFAEVVKEITTNINSQK
ncbi:MAG: chromosomal replication initiator protein DnaA [Oscillospiraceae bacterium]